MADADHPRSCGANFQVCSRRLCDCGSSPLVRGQPASVAKDLIRNRIIPARAGPTRCGKSIYIAYPDHPRSCGANARRDVQVIPQYGSSPLVRGQLLKKRINTQNLRIIPARAGPTVAAAASPWACPDHPRSCGANCYTPQRITC